MARYSPCTLSRKPLLLIGSSVAFVHVDAVGRPILFWQIPVGNASQGNSEGHWQDNRVDYLFHHAADVVASAGAIGLAFGAGESHQTTPSTDGGYLIEMTNGLAAQGGVAICP